MYQWGRYLVYLAVLSLPIWFFVWIGSGQRTSPAKQTAAPIIDVCSGRPQPREGIKRIYTNVPRPARLTIKTAFGGNYLVGLETFVDERPVMSVFVEGGSTLSADVPLGTFILHYAAGKSWCSDQELFGATTSFHKADDIFTFARTETFDGYEISNWTVELILQKGGNLRTTRIDRGAFKF